jgi:dynactin complex subunit
VYTLEKNNSRVDALSYRHDIAETKKVINTAILKVNDDGLLELARTLNLLM